MIKLSAKIWRIFAFSLYINLVFFSFNCNADYSDDDFKKLLHNLPGLELGMNVSDITGYKFEMDSQGVSAIDYKNHSTIGIYNKRIWSASLGAGEIIPEEIIASASKYFISHASEYEVISNKKDELMIRDKDGNQLKIIGDYYISIENTKLKDTLLSDQFQLEKIKNDNMHDETEKQYAAQQQQAQREYELKRSQDPDTKLAYITENQSPGKVIKEADNASLDEFESSALKFYKLISLLNPSAIDMISDEKFSDSTGGPAKENKRATRKFIESTRLEALKKIPSLFLTGKLSNILIETFDQQNGNKILAVNGMLTVNDLRLGEITVGARGVAILFEKLSGRYQITDYNINNK